jgi:hypothetical protein
MGQAMDRVLKTAGFIIFAVCGSAGLMISAVTGLLMIWIGCRLEDKQEEGKDG